MTCGSRRCSWERPGAWLAGGNLPLALVFALVVAVSVDVGLQAN